MAASPSVFPIDQAGSFVWIAHPQEAIQRASTALLLDGGWLLVDPLIAPGLDQALGSKPVCAVAILFQRHARDGRELARKLGAPLLVARALGGSGVKLAEVEERPLAAWRCWCEAILWLPDRGLLVCPETLGTIPHFLARDGDVLGVHPLARLLSSFQAFEGVRPERIAVGHGPPVREHAASALARVLRSPRRETPRAWARAIARTWASRAGP